MDEILNEERYQEANRKVKIVGTVIMLIGLALIAGGVYFLVTASNMNVPPMTDSHWYEASSSQMHTESTGAFMLIPGIFLTIAGLMVRFVIGNQRKIMAYQMQQMAPLVKEGAEKAKKMAKDLKDDDWQ